MNVAVVGPGALGCLFAARLSEAGHDVWLVHHRERAARELSASGVRIEREGATALTASVDATADAADVGTADLVLLLVRAHQTRDALDEHAACIGPGTCVLSLQNGLRNYDAVREAVGDDRAFCGVTYEAAVAEGAGTVRYTSPGPTTFGGGRDVDRERIRTALSTAGFDVETVADPRPVVWEKGALVLATAPVVTLTGCPVSRLVDEPLRGTVDRLLAEAVQVAAARGIVLDVDEVRATVASLASSHGDHRVSMAQDVDRGRRTEVGELNGAVVQFADEEDVPVPANRQVTALVAGLERCSR